MKQKSTVYRMERKQAEEELTKHRDHLEELIAERTEEVQNEISSHEQTAEALRQTEERLRLAIRGSSDGMWDWPDITKDDEWWSVRWYELLGYQDGEVEASYSKFGEFLHPDDVDSMKEAVRAHFEERVLFDMEYRLKMKSGEYRWFRGRGQALWDDQGKPIRMSGSIQDIDERRRAQAALASQETLYRTLIDSIPHVIWLASAEGQATFLNKAWQEWTGRDVEESLGSKWAESVHPEDAPGLLAKWERAYKHGEPYEGECRFKTKEGSYKAVTFIGTPVRDDSGKISNWVGINIDITERKQAEEALRRANEELERRVEERTEELQKALDRLGKEIEESEQARTALVESEKRLSHILESAMDAIIAINDARCIVLFNEAAETVFRCPAAEAIGKPIDRFLSKSFGNLLTSDLQDF